MLFRQEDERRRKFGIAIQCLNTFECIAVVDVKGFTADGDLLPRKFWAGGELVDDFV